jgi:hypothetical protein
VLHTAIDETVQHDITDAKNLCFAKSVDFNSSRGHEARAFIVVITEVRFQKSAVSIRTEGWQTTLLASARNKTVRAAPQICQDAIWGEPRARTLRGGL